MGSWRLALVYFITGAGGFMLGGAFSDIRTPSVGASGSLYGTIHDTKRNQACLHVFYWN